ncbi:MAG TPA: nucleotide sugar dehydrogenase [Rhabdochlamydiaceae bacterium]|nr:nucleotide sugar dehydrogenase [Rhabdochlamydiaceae bacterium]
MKISVVGLGKLGSPLLAVLASKGYEVIGVDVNDEFVQKINKGVAPVNEPQLQELISKTRLKIRATQSYDKAILGTEVTLIIVPTPSGKDGSFSNEYLIQAMEQIGRSLTKKRGYHLVVIKSTVMPGSTGGEIRQALETASNRTLGNDLGLCYSPEFIALGNVVRNLLSPDLVLIGESDKKAGDILEKIYISTCDNKPTIQRMNFVNAEIAKISINTYVTTKISYSNMLSDVCQQIEGADVDIVTAAVGVDSRIGSKYLKPGVAFGGPCFPRDNIAFGVLARKIGARADIAYATQEINKYQNHRLHAVIEKHAKTNKIAVLGLAYKPGTSVVEESQSIQIANQLSEKGYQVSVYDPMALEEARKMLVKDIRFTGSVTESLESSDTIIIMTPWPEFSKEIKPDLLQDKTVVDCWRLLPLSEFADSCNLIYLGYGYEPIETLALRK